MAPHSNKESRPTSANMAALFEADHVPSRPMLKDSTPYTPSR